MCEHDSDNNNKIQVKENKNKEYEEKQYLEYKQYRDKIIDSHCHIQEDIEHIKESCDLPFKKVILMGTTVQDWDRINKLADAIDNDEKVIRGFGIHPWFAHNYNPPTELLEKELINDSDTTKEIIKNDETWVPIMRELLTKYQNSIVGELGVDKVTKVRINGYNKNDQEGQLKIFTKQIELANEFNRIVSLHCVQLHGKILSFFQSLELDKFPPSIALHTFSGKPATVVQFLKMAGGRGDRFYFGLSFINLTSSKVDKLIQAIPDDRLLLESDQNTPLDAESSIFKLIQKVSDSKNWSIQKTIEQTSLNTLNFISKNNNK